jgi:hypothetical protein
MVLYGIPLFNQTLLVLTGTGVSGAANLGDVECESTAQQPPQQVLVTAVVTRRTSVAI